MCKYIFLTILSGLVVILCFLPVKNFFLYNQPNLKFMVSSSSKTCPLHDDSVLDNRTICWCHFSDAGSDFPIRQQSPRYQPDIV